MFQSRSNYETGEESFGNSVVANRSASRLAPAASGKIASLLFHRHSHIQLPVRKDCKTAMRVLLMFVVQNDFPERVTLGRLIQVILFIVVAVLSVA